MQRGRYNACSTERENPNNRRIIGKPVPKTTRSKPDTGNTPETKLQFRRETGTFDFGEKRASRNVMQRKNFNIWLDRITNARMWCFEMGLLIFLTFRNTSMVSRSIITKEPSRAMGQPWRLVLFVFVHVEKMFCFVKSMVEWAQWIPNGDFFRFYKQTFELTRLWLVTDADLFQQKNFRKCEFLNIFLKFSAFFSTTWTARFLLISLVAASS